MEPLPCPLERRELLQRLLLHGKVGFEIHVRGLNAFMPEPECNGGDVDPCLQQMHGGRVANDMRRDVFGGEAGAGRARAGLPVVTGSPRHPVTALCPWHWETQCARLAPPAQQTRSSTPGWWWATGVRYAPSDLCRSAAQRC